MAISEHGHHCPNCGHKAGVNGSQSAAQMRKRAQILVEAYIEDSLGADQRMNDVEFALWILFTNGFEKGREVERQRLSVEENDE